MFGIDDMLLFPLVGGATGALLSGNKPMQGALLGAGLGAGGAALPGLLSASPAAVPGAVAAGSSAAPAALSVSQFMNPATVNLGSSASLIGGAANSTAPTGGALIGSTSADMFAPSMVNLGNSSLLMNGAANPALASVGSASGTTASSAADLMSQLKPFQNALSAANTAKSLFSTAQSQQQHPQTSPMMQNIPNNNLGALLQTINTDQQARQQAEQQKQQMLRAMWSTR